MSALRGIIFTGGEGPAPLLARDLIPERALIVAADSGLLAAEAAGVFPHAVIGDMDSLAETPGGLERLVRYPPGRIHRRPRAKDQSDTELALDILLAQGCCEVWIIGGGGGRLDHLLAIRALFDRPAPPSRWLTAREDCRLAAAPASLDAHGLGPEAPVSIFPVGGGPWRAHSEGLFWPVDGLRWGPFTFSLSNRAPSGAFRFSALEGRFLVITPLAAAGQPLPAP
ncbi:MAG: thiamine pyrophosphokinase [Treponema sp.]|nr:thiamine pyrophosphokinase [Treponema sp.]